MKPKSLRLVLLALTAASSTTYAATLTGYDGIELKSDGNIQVQTYQPGSDPDVRNLDLLNYVGTVTLYSGPAATTLKGFDGGVLLESSLVGVLLDTPPSGTPQSFVVWDLAAWQTSYGLPLLEIDAASGDTTFTNSDVAINGGSLKVGGNDVLTTASTSYVSPGNVTNQASLALGISTASSQYAVSFGQSTASGLQSFAAGHYSTASGAVAFAFGQTHTASGSFSTAFGNNNTASGMHSWARGNTNSATGAYSTVSGTFSSAGGSFAVAEGSHASASTHYAMALGSYTSARTNNEVVIGRYNVESTANATWAEQDALFRLGNGSSTARTDALSVQKNGTTTLINKEWNSAYTTDEDTALDDPAATTDNGGDALVVRGHTRLKGKVVIEVAQGDISMGIYGE